MSLQQVYIDQFIEDGVVVIPSVISKQFIDGTIQEINQYLHKSCGFDSADMLTTSKGLSSMSSTNGSGGILDIYYQHWKLRLNEDPTVVSILQSLWEHTYATYHDSINDGTVVTNEQVSDDAYEADKTGEDNGDGADDHHIFSHPYGDFNPYHGYMYIDRVCYRLPTAVSNSFGKSKRTHLHRSLTPHLDCCPHNMHRPGGKWRPIQAFISLTETILPEQGGFEACLGLHKRFKQWTLERMRLQDTTPAKGTMSLSRTNCSNDTDHLPPCVGDFTPIRPVEDRDILERFQHVPCKAGDMVCWDYRIPHANSRYNHSEHPRIVIYIGLLPDVPVNKRYAEHQLSRYQQGFIPTDQWQEMNTTGVRESSSSYEFSLLGKRLMGIVPWEDDNL